MKRAKIYTFIINMLLVFAVFHFANPSFTDKNLLEIATEKSTQESQQSNSLELDDTEESENEEKFFVLFMNNTPSLIHLVSIKCYLPQQSNSNTIKNNPYKPPIFS